MFKSLAAGIFLVVLTVSSAALADQVVLLHGIGRAKSMMAPLEKNLTLAGYDVLNIDYPSTTAEIEALAKGIHPFIKEFRKNGLGKLHFVGHSMGGLVTRSYIAQYKPENLGRVVMIGTPNGGSEVADFLKDLWVYQWAYGPAGQQLTTDRDYDALYGKISYETGVIAGTWTVDPVSYFIIPGKNDGKVSIARTKVKGMADHIVLPVTHTFMASNEEVMAQTLHFLKEGTFAR